MDQDDENYNLMTVKQEDYMAAMKEEATEKGVKITQWEWEEIEMAYEHGFAQGFIAGNQAKRLRSREEREALN